MSDEFVEMMTEMTGMNPDQMVEEVIDELSAETVELFDKKKRVVECRHIGFEQEMNEGEAFLLMHAIAKEFGWATSVVTVHDINEMMGHIYPEYKEMDFRGAVWESMTAALHQTWSWTKLPEIIGRGITALSAIEMGFIDRKGLEEDMKEALVQMIVEVVKAFPKTRPLDHEFGEVSAADQVRDNDNPMNEDLIKTLPALAHEYEVDVEIDEERLAVDGEYRLDCLLQVMAKVHGVPADRLREVYEATNETEEDDQ